MTTIRNTPMTHEEKRAYALKCDAVAQKLYSLDHHFCRWEEASDRVRERYQYKAHMSRVWWNLEAQSDSTAPADYPS